MKRRRIDVDLGELDQLLDQAREAPLSEPDCHRIKTTLHVLVELLTARRSTEKTSAVVDPGKNGAAAAELWRPVYESDSYLRSERRERVRLPGGTTATSQRIGGQPVRMDALELLRDHGSRQRS